MTAADPRSALPTDSSPAHKGGERSVPRASHPLPSGFAVSVALGLAALWWLLVDGDPASWILGVPAVAAGVWLAVRLHGHPGGAPSVPGLLRLAPYFLYESLRGGIDVAGRTLSPRLRVRPGLYVYRVSLSQRGARVLFANCVSLLPGTLAAGLDGERLVLHLLDLDSDPEADLRRLEGLVQGVFPNDSKS